MQDCSDSSVLAMDLLEVLNHAIDILIEGLRIWYRVAS